MSDSMGERTPKPIREAPSSNAIDASASIAVSDGFNKKVPKDKRGPVSNLAKMRVILTAAASAGIIACMRGDNVGIPTPTAVGESAAATATYVSPETPTLKPSGSPPAPESTATPTIENRQNHSKVLDLLEKVTEERGGSIVGQGEKISYHDGRTFLFLKGIADPGNPDYELLMYVGVNGPKAVGLPKSQLNFFIEEFQKGTDPIRIEAEVRKSHYVSIYHLTKEGFIQMYLKNIDETNNADDLSLNELRYSSNPKFAVERSSGADLYESLKVVQESAPAPANVENPHSYSKVMDLLEEITEERGEDIIQRGEKHENYDGRGFLFLKGITEPGTIGVATEDGNEILMLVNASGALGMRMPKSEVSSFVEEFKNGHFHPLDTGHFRYANIFDSIGWPISEPGKFKVDLTERAIVAMLKKNVNLPNEADTLSLSEFTVNHSPKSGDSRPNTIQLYRSLKAVQESKQ